MISQKNIADHLNLGRSTVANILRNPDTPKYNEKTRQAVLAAAEQFGYRPNRASRSVRMGRSNLIGVIHFGSSYEVGRRIGESLSKCITRRGYDLFVVDLAWHGGNFRRAIDLLVESRVEGVVISQMVECFGAQEISLLTRAGIPAISLQGSDAWGIPVVYGDVGEAFREMVHHLVGAGHRRLLLMANDYTAVSTRSRIGGFTKAITEAGGKMLPNRRSDGEVIEWPVARQPGLVGKIARLSAEGSYFDPAYEYTRRLIESGSLPDAIVASNDRWAKGIITALMQAGLRVPEEVAVTGCDNDAFAAHTPYYLTTIEQAIAEEAAVAVDLLLELLQKRALPRQEYLFPCSLVVRRSCGAPPVSPTLTKKVHS